MQRYDKNIKKSMGLVLLAGAKKSTHGTVYTVQCSSGDLKWQLQSLNGNQRCLVNILLTFYVKKNMDKKRKIKTAYKLRGCSKF